MNFCIQYICRNHPTPPLVRCHPLANGELFSMLKIDGMRPIVRHQPTFAIPMALYIQQALWRQLPVRIGELSLAVGFGSMATKVFSMPL